MNILIETSARHVHLSQDDLEALFGNDYSLNKRKDLSQPGQYVCNEKVTIEGPKKTLANVSIIGPVRKHTQVELSATDARNVGIDAPVRESGDLNDTPGCRIVGPNGTLNISNCVIIPKRHTHFRPEDAAKANASDGQILSVKIPSDERALIFDDVVVRVSKSFAPAMHIDTDESNAAMAKPGTLGEIIK